MLIARLGFAVICVIGFGTPLCAANNKAELPRWPTVVLDDTRDAAPAETIRSLPEVQTVAQLLQTPEMEAANGIRVRLAVSPAQAELPVRWLYCLTDKPGGLNAKVADWPGDPMGPLFINVTGDGDGDELRRLRDLCAVMYALLPNGAQVLYATPIRLDHDERVQLFAADGRELVRINSQLQKDAEAWSWFAAMREPSQLQQASEQIEAPTDGERSTRVLDYRSRARLQPAFLRPQCTSLRVTDDNADTVIGSASKLILKQEGDSMVLCADDATGRRLLYDVKPEALLFRWWVDGRAVPTSHVAERLQVEEVMRMETLRHSDTAEVDTRVRFRPIVPIELTTVRPGDVVQVQLLVWPGKWTAQRLGNAAISGCDEQIRMRDEPEAPLFGISNRFDLKVTDDMIIE